jgi:molecular chaperone DnaK
LSAVVETTINLPFIYADANGPKHLELELTRAKFEEITGELTYRCIRPFRQALSDAQITVDAIAEVVLVGGATRMPVIQQLVRKLTGRPPRQGVNPDEVVALGAAVQASILTGDLRNVVLLDVASLSLGVETVGGVFKRIIKRNTQVPVKRSEMFTTGQDNQTGVDVHVLQGEREMVTDNQSLGHFTLDGIPPAPAGVPQIEVTFEIDHNGIVSVTARDVATGHEQAITLSASTNLTPEQVQQLVEDAARNAAEDAARRQQAELLNNAEGMLFVARRYLESDLASDERERRAIARAVEELTGYIARNEQESLARAARRLRMLLPEGYDPIGPDRGIALSS